MRTLALFLPNWIGDAVMATPAIRAAREYFRNVRIVAVCKPAVADTLAAAPWIDSVISMPKSRIFTTLRSLNAARIDAAVLFPNSLRSALLAKLAGARTIAGFARSGRDALLTHRVYPLRDTHGAYKPTPIIDDYNRIVRRLGVPDPGHRLELFTTTPDDEAAARFWQQARLDRFTSVVGLNTGGAFGASKRWPHFAELANALARRGHGVVVLCGPAEREEAIRIAAEARHPNVVSLSSAAVSVGLSKAIVRRLSLLVSTDSGPRHFAHAFNVPVVALFGPTHIEWTETFFDKAILLQQKLPCGPCQQRICPLTHHDCMTKLTATAVLAAALQLLSQSTAEARSAG